MAKKNKRPSKPAARTRTVRREADREAEKLRAQLARLYASEPGGSAERPISLQSPSQVEVDAIGRPCVFCGGRLRLEGPHEVEDHGGERLRVARLACTECRARLDRYYRIGAVLN